MANATSAIHQIDGDERYVELPIAAATKLAPGAGVTIISASGMAGNAGDTVGTKPAGIAEPAGQGDDDIDNTAGAAGAKKVRVRTRGLARFAATGVDATWVGQTVYWVDNQTVALAATTTNDIPAGIVRKFVSATVVEIELVGLGRSTP